MTTAQANVGNRLSSVRRSDRQARIDRARDVALRLVRPIGYIEIGGELIHLSEFNQRGVRIKYYEPKLRGSATPRKLIIRHNGEVVLLIEWTPEQQLRTSYKPGDWGPIMLRHHRIKGQLARTA